MQDVIPTFEIENSKLKLDAFKAAVFSCEEWPKLKATLALLLQKIGTSRFESNYEDRMEVCLIRVMQLSQSTRYVTAVLSRPPLEPLIAGCMDVVNRYFLPENRRRFLMTKDPKRNYNLLSYVGAFITDFSPYPNLIPLLKENEKAEKEWEAEEARKAEEVKNISAYKNQLWNEYDNINFSTLDHSGRVELAWKLTVWAWSLDEWMLQDLFFHDMDYYFFQIAVAFPAFDWALDLFIKNGADVNKPDMEGRNLFVQAVGLGMRRWVERLLDYHVDISVLGPFSEARAFIYKSFRKNISDGDAIWARIKQLHKRNVGRAIDYCISRRESSSTDLLMAMWREQVQGYFASDLDCLRAMLDVEHTSTDVSSLVSDETVAQLTPLDVWILCRCPLSPEAQACVKKHHSYAEAFFSLAQSKQSVLEAAHQAFEAGKFQEACYFILLLPVTDDESFLRNDLDEKFSLLNMIDIFVKNPPADPLALMSTLMSLAGKVKMVCELMLNPPAPKPAMTLEELNDHVESMTETLKRLGRNMEYLKKLEDSVREMMGWVKQKEWEKLDALTYEEKYLLCVWGNLKDEDKKLLIQRGFGPYLLNSCIQDIKDEYKYPPALESLLDLGITPDKKDGAGDAPLYVAASLGSISAVIILLKRGATWNIECHGQTPRDIARQSGNNFIVTILDSAEKKAKAHVMNLQIHALKRQEDSLGDSEERASAVLQPLLDLCVNLNEKDGNDECPLFVAARIGCVSAVRWLLQQGAQWKVACHGETPQSVAHRKGYLVIEALFDRADGIEDVNFLGALTKETSKFLRGSFSPVQVTEVDENGEEVRQGQSARLG